MISKVVKKHKKIEIEFLWMLAKRVVERYTVLCYNSHAWRKK